MADPLQMLVGSTMKITLQDVEVPAGTPLMSVSGTFNLTAIINDGQGQAAFFSLAYFAANCSAQRVNERCANTALSFSTMVPGSVCGADKPAPRISSHPVPEHTRQPALPIFPLPPQITQPMSTSALGSVKGK